MEQYLELGIALIVVFIVYILLMAFVFYVFLWVIIHAGFNDLTPEEFENDKQNKLNVK